MNSFNSLIDKYQNTTILLIGDIMLDIFVYGGVSRISPEGPIPILSVSREDEMLGGAGNVLANLRALGSEVHLISVIGDDLAGHKITQKVGQFEVSAEGLVIDAERMTTLKTRYLSQNQQLLRVDSEKSVTLASDVQSKILVQAEKVIGTAQVLILSDYGKGMLTPDLIKQLIKLAKKNNVPVIVDPKAKDFSIYKGATIVTPNKKELSEAVGDMAVASDGDVEAAAQTLIKQSGIENVIATRSEDGMSVVFKKGNASHLKTRALEVFDVSGAGDTVVAVIAATIAAGGSLDNAAYVANIAGGLAVAKIGTAIVRAEEILAAMDKENEVISGNTHLAPIADQDIAVEQIRKWQAQGLKVGFTGGCFDILHYGHVNYLAQAHDKCDRLVVGLNHDRSVRILKGAERPINDEIARATVLAALGAVDLVVFFGAGEEGQDNTPCGLVTALKPDILMKGGDYTADQLPEGKIVLSYGGEVDILPLFEGYSTSNIIRKSKTEAA